MARLLDLPEELLILIAQNLQKREYGDCGYRPLRKHLVQLCLVSTLLLPATQKVLYSEFWCDKQEETWRIRAFLRTTIANPSLASHVLSSDVNRGYDVNRKYSAAQNRSDRKLFRKAIHDLALSDKTFWRSAVRKDVDEVYAALLMLVLPNLRELGIMTPLRHEVLDKALNHATLLRSTYTPLVSLQKVEEIDYCYRGNVAKGDVHNLIPFFRLPSIKNLGAGNLLISSKPWPQLPEQPTLEILKLFCDEIQPEVLGDILRGLINLKDFSYLTGSCFESFDFHPQRFGLALTNAAASLKRIYIGGSYWSREDGTILGSFRSFTNLQHFTTELQWLLGDDRLIRLVDILPPSLEVLCLTFSPERCDHIIYQFRELVLAKPSLMPNLRSIWDDFPRSMHQTPAYSALLDVCREKDVTLARRDFTH